ncbi:hypothetical protein [Roseateles violae]|uniref:Uncharacterized protein n=1 Tax=Roseateles violae TaxID=3058042 RepID=A0ABT8DNG3_9BURK|nr:hypothetical protein [Pelomonas sp. PFR6]MDN3919523.1 hypothetical protein [Pelomonas sp. PFR6]
MKPLAELVRSIDTALTGLPSAGLGLALALALIAADEPPAPRDAAPAAVHCLPAAAPGPSIGE